MIVTGIGSLPHDDADEAARFVLDTVDLPYLPQLPNRHPEEGMIAQWGDGLCSCGADGRGELRYGRGTGPREEAFVGAAALVAVGPHDSVKTQVTGPVTMATALARAGHPETGLWDCVVDGLLQRLADHLAWVAGLARQTFVFVDEPALVAFGPEGRPAASAPDAVAALLRFFADAPAPLGLHCCGPTDWALVASLRPTVIAWDLETLDRGLGEAGPALAEAFSAGTVPCWGIVPARSGPVAPPRARYGAAVARLVLEGAPVDSLTANAWFSPACGLAALSVEWADRVARSVRATIEEIRV